MEGTEDCIFGTVTDAMGRLERSMGSHILRTITRGPDGAKGIVVYDRYAEIEAWACLHTLNVKGPSPIYGTIDSRAEPMKPIACLPCILHKTQESANEHVAAYEIAYAYECD